MFFGFWVEKSLTFRKWPPKMFDWKNINLQQKWPAGDGICQVIRSPGSCTCHYDEVSTRLLKGWSRCRLDLSAVCFAAKHQKAGKKMCIDVNIYIYILTGSAVYWICRQMIADVNLHEAVSCLSGESSCGAVSDGLHHHVVCHSQAA